MLGAEEPAETESKLSEKLEDILEEEKTLEPSVDNSQTEIKQGTDCDNSFIVHGYHIDESFFGILWIGLLFSDEIKREEKPVIEEKDGMERDEKIIEQDEETVAVEPTEDDQTETEEKKEAEYDQKEIAKKEKSDSEKQGNFSTYIF